MKYPIILFLHMMFCLFFGIIATIYPERFKDIGEKYGLIWSHPPNAEFWCRIVGIGALIMFVIEVTIFFDIL